MSEILLKILALPNVCSKLPVYENYDKNVQGISVIEPGEADASVLQPFVYNSYPEEIRQIGVSFKVDHNPRYGKISPYWVGVNSVAECLRNLAAVGSSPQALTDCLNFGNPEKPEQMWDFVESVRGVAEACKKYKLREHPESSIPIVSGNVSLYKESKGKAIAPSPIISGVGKIQDVSQSLTQNFQKPGSVLLLLGERKDECGGSVYYDLFDELGANVPQPDFQELQRSIYGLVEAAENNLILSCHDISDGGLSTCLAEMSFRNEIGLEVEIKQENLREDKVLFGETGGFVLEVEKENLQEIQKLFEVYSLKPAIIGKTTDSKKIKINQSISLNLLTAKEAWENSLREIW
jgi:phosphoribosylformylglycinamidine synthase